MGRHRILIIGHTYTAPVNRLKFEPMARNWRFELLFVTPRKRRNYVTVADNTPSGEIPGLSAGPGSFFGKETPGI